MSRIARSSRGPIACSARASGPSRDRRSSARSTTSTCGSTPPPAREGNSIRFARPDTVALWHKITTAEDAEWTRRYHSEDPDEKAFGGRGIEAFPNATAYVKRVTARPAYQKAMAIAGPKAAPPAA